MIYIIYQFGIFILYRFGIIMSSKLSKFLFSLNINAFKRIEKKAAYFSDKSCNGLKSESEQYKPL